LVWEYRFKRGTQLESKVGGGVDQDAQVAPGQKYESGIEVVENSRLAAKWYRKAAEHVSQPGVARQGRNKLGLLNIEGRGVPQNYVQA
jgi:TPR repeat protein